MFWDFQYHIRQLRWLDCIHLIAKSLTRVIFQNLMQYLTTALLSPKLKWCLKQEKGQRLLLKGVQDLGCQEVLLCALTVERYFRWAFITGLLLFQGTECLLFCSILRSYWATSYRMRSSLWKCSYSKLKRGPSFQNNSIVIMNPKSALLPDFSWMLKQES